MALINEHFLKLQNNYLFSDIAKKVNSFKVTHPKKKIIRMGIGDVTQPLAPAVIEAMHKAVDEMASKDTFHGYGPEQGYPFLIDAIIKNDYASRGIFLEPGEVFVSDGAKSDCGNIGDMLRHDNSIGVTDPVYPVYIDSNVMSGRTGTLENGKWSDVVYIPCTEANNFVPDLPSRRVDIIYLCYPNNPTGTTLTKEELKKWVNYALANDCLIMYDSAYEAYIQDPNIPHSIYEIKGAKKVAIEFRSFSKTAGFTGVRCGYTIVPKELNAFTLAGERKEQVRKTIDYYMANARIMRESLQSCGLRVYGGENAPYIWLKTPDGLSSWKFFDKLLYEVNIVGTPGVGFGPGGEGFLRLTAFGDRDDTLEAMSRLKKWLL